MNQPLQPEELRELRTNLGNDVLSLSQEQPVLLIFLRQLGCMFCREAMTQLGKLRPSLEANGTQLVFIHMGPAEVAEKLFKKYKLNGCEHVTDPDSYYYARFGLTKCNISQLFGLTAWAKTMEYGLIKGHEYVLPIGDGFQMPGLFMLQNGLIIAEFRHTAVYDQPDYAEFVACCATSK